jgi:uncharacterized membrane protein
MMDMMGGMGLMMLVGLLVVAIVIGVTIYLAVRAGVGSDRLHEPEPRALLERRLAAGEISPEEYFERESALRDSQAGHRRR